MRAGVLEGDVAGSFDADRLSLLHIPVAQLNTGAASAASATSTRTWSARRCPSLPLDELDLLVIENVGNLVCPAEFRVGEDARIMVCSVAEGEDKPLKYPLMFRACELVLVNKIDLLPHLDVDVDRLLANLDAVNPGVEHMLVSARTGEGVDAFRDWLAAVPGRVRAGDRPRRDRRAAADADRGTFGQRERVEAGERCFGAEADRIARLCHRAAERFARGGRLIALGRSPAARSDARHVAVEFVHPVIVGKRALPALALAPRAGRSTRRSRSSPSPATCVIAFEREDPETAAAVALAAARLPAGRLRPARRRVRAPGADRDRLPRAVGARARVLRASRPARGPPRRRPRQRRIGLPLPVPRRAGARPRRGLADVRASVLAKAAETGALRMQTLAEQRAPR